MIVTKDTVTELRKGLDHLKRKERIKVAEKMINRLSARKRPLEEELAHLNNELTYWRQLRLIELYHSTPVEKVEPYIPRKVRKDKGFSRRKPSKDQIAEAFQRLPKEEQRKIIKRLSKEVSFEVFRVKKEEV